MVTESRLTAAIIGAGKIAGMYADPMAERATTHAQAINKSNNIDLVGIVDSNMMKAQIFADRWNLPNTFPTVDKLLDTIKCDLIAICSPDQTHAEILNNITQHKASPRFVTAEKPLCTAPDQLAEIEKKVGGNKNIQIALNHVRRFDARASSEGCSVRDRRPRLDSIRSIRSGSGSRPRTARITELGSSKIGLSSRSSKVLAMEYIPAQMVSHRQTSHALPLPWRNSS